jgi:starch phosphorylase
MLLTEQLVHGVDVWINNPRRPWEACGTSGMKVLANGGLNLSELDGWWAEAFEQDVGWALGDGREHGDDPQWDAAEAEALYTLLEKEVVPLFYERDQHGLPRGWIARVRESMARLTPQYSADRTVREYTEKYYLPAASAYRERRREAGAAVAQMLGWRQALAENWAGVRLGPLQVGTREGQHDFELQVYLGNLSPDFVQVELYANAPAGGAPERHVMVRNGRPESAEDDGAVYSVRVAAARPASDYTPRIIPHHPGALIPLEAPQIQWER